MVDKHYCGGEIIYIHEECIWYCQRCGEKFCSIEALEESNLIAQESDIE